MRSIRVSPSAISAEITRLAEARRSVAMTGAPLSVWVPVTIAVLPSTWMCAPMRCISYTCMKRFSKMVSMTAPVPSAMAFREMNWACMSVGNAGYGAVRTLTAFGRLPCMFSSIQSSPVVISAPASLSFSSTASRMVGSVSLTFTRPPVAAAATR
ncbi:hypothetical protein D3C84_791320 [compost metagenome]